MTNNLKGTLKIQTKNDLGNIKNAFLENLNSEKINIPLSVQTNGQDGK